MGTTTVELSALGQSRVDLYPRVELHRSNRDWNKGCFESTSTPPASEPQHWPWGPNANAQKGLKPRLDCIGRMLGERPHQAAHNFGIAPTVELLEPSLIAWAFPSEAEIRTWLEEVLGTDKATSLVIPIPGQPPMLPNLGVVDPLRITCGGLHSSRATVPEEKSSTEGRRRRNHLAAETEWEKEVEKKTRLHKENQRQERQRRMDNELTVTDFITPCDPPSLSIGPTLSPSLNSRSPCPRLDRPPSRALTRGTLPGSSGRQERRRTLGLIARPSSPPAVSPSAHLLHVHRPGGPASSVGACEAPARECIQLSSRGLGSPPSSATIPSPPEEQESMASVPAEPGTAPSSATPSRASQALPERASGSPLVAPSEVPAAGTTPSTEAAPERAATPMAVPTPGQPTQAGTGEFVGATPVEEVTMEELFGEVDAGTKARLKAVSVTSPAGAPASGVSHLQLTWDASGIGGPSRGPWVLSETLGQVVSFPAALQEMADTLHTVLVPSAYALSSPNQALLRTFLQVQGSRQEAEDQARRAWLTAKAAKDVGGLESALTQQAAAHEKALAALTAERDGLCAQIVEVRDGESLAPLSPASISQPALTFLIDVEALKKEKAEAIRECMDASTARAITLQEKENTEAMNTDLVMAEARAEELEAAVQRVRGLEAMLETSAKAAMKKVEGFTYRSSLQSAYKTHHDASVAVMVQLGFPMGGDIERFPAGLQHAALCCGALRDTLVMVLGELDLSMSGDPIHLLEELCRILFHYGALAKQALVHGVQEAFTLTHSHYDGICFNRMLHGFPDEYLAEALDALTAEVKESAERFANALVPLSDADGTLWMAPARSKLFDSASTLLLDNFCWCAVLRHEREGLWVSCLGVNCYVFLSPRALVQFADLGILASGSVSIGYRAPESPSPWDFRAFEPLCL
nr:unnamed protein product [Digitaria exilis]